MAMGSSRPGCELERAQLEEELDALWHMDQCGSVPSPRMYSSMLKACAERKALAEAKRVHAHLAMHGLLSNKFLGECLVITLVKCGSLVDALHVFGGLSQRTVFSWTAVISGYTTAGHGLEALRMYASMREEGVEPDKYTFVVLLKACGILAEPGKGKCLHAEAFRYGHDSDVFVATGLLDMYAKCGSMVDAQNVFDGLPHRDDVVSWNVMLAAYVQQDEADKAWKIYEHMHEEGVNPDNRTFVGALQACALLAETEAEVTVDGRLTRSKALEQGKAIHAYARRRGYDSDVFVGSTLVTLYGKCGSIVDAESVFHRLAHRNVVSWNAMIAAHAQHGQAEKALHLFKQMRQEDGASPDEVTLICVLQACCETGSLDVCREVHRAIVLAGNKWTVPLGNSLLHAYGRCASMVEAQTVFDGLPERNVVSWSALIAGYAHDGNSAQSLHYYDEMLRAGVKPNGYTFSSLLSACSRAGLVDKGVALFESMTTDHAVTPEIVHYTIMVDLLGRAGYFASLTRLFRTMPMQPDLAIWLCLLGACRKHANLVLAKHAFESAVKLCPDHAAAYVLMSNIYADAGLVEQARAVYDMSLRRGAWKEPGQSWIKHDQELETFVVGDRNHSQHEQVIDLLRKLPSLPSGPSGLFM